MNLERVANEVFQILRSYNYEVALFDEDGTQVFEPGEAHRFFDKSKNLTVALLDDGNDSAVKLYFRKDIPVETIAGLMQTLRTTATKFNMVFTCREQDGEISPKEFATKVSVAEARSAMNITEGMYGTSRSSYLRLENARMIVRHSAKINEDLMGARGRNIDSIYIENGVGERFLFPTVQLAPARAMTHHVSNGGSWVDDGGQSICALAQDYADLRALSRHIYHNANRLEESAGEVRSTLREAARKMHRTFESICRKTRYEDVMQALKKPLVEDDLSEAINGLKSLCAVEGREVDDRVYETCARCLREVEHERDDARHVMVTGVRVDRETWENFKRGKLALKSSIEHAPDVSGYRAFNTRALDEIGEACADENMAKVFHSASAQFATTSSLNVSLKAFAGKALEIVGWKVPRDIIPTESVKELGEWMDDHTHDRDPREVEEHCGHCPDDLELDEDAADGNEVEEPIIAGRGDHDVDIELGDEGDDLTMSDIILPTNDTDALKNEVTKSTVEDPDTGEEVLPSTRYIQRLRALAGVAKPNGYNLY